MAGSEKLDTSKVEQHVTDLVDRLKAVSLSVGFLEGSTYPNGMSVPAIAMLNEFGGSMTIPARQQTIFKSKNAKGTKFLRKGQFVKASKANFSSIHPVGSHTVTIPPRPFFRTMIAKNKASWGPDAARLLRANDFDTTAVAGLMGQRIKGQLQQSILATNSPPNAASTIRKKGSSNPLIDSGLMLSRVDYKVE